MKDADYMNLIARVAHGRELVIINNARFMIESYNYSREPNYREFGYVDTTALDEFAPPELMKKTCDILTIVSLTLRAIDPTGKGFRPATINLHGEAEFIGSLIKVSLLKPEP